MSPQSSGSKNTPSVKKGSKLNWFHADFLFGLFLDPEDGGDMFFRNIGGLSTKYTELYPRR
jgi:hypothetical protein